MVVVNSDPHVMIPTNRKKERTLQHLVSTAVGGVKKAAKAIYASITAAISGLILVTMNGAGFESVTTNQWLVIALSVVVAGGGVYGLTNK